MYTLPGEREFRPSRVHFSQLDFKLFVAGAMSKVIFVSA